MALASEEAASDADAEVIVHRGNAGGPYQPFQVTVDGGLFAVRGLLRLQGTPFGDTDIPAVQPGIEGLLDVFDGFTPERNGTTQRLEPASPATVQTVSLSGQALHLKGSSHEPQFGVYTFYRSLAVI